MSKNFFTLNPDGQGTLDEILDHYKDYTVYGIGNNDILYVVDATDCCIQCFENIGYEDDECTPIVYEVFTDHLHQQFSYVADMYLEDQCTITKLQGGIK